VKRAAPSGVVATVTLATVVLAPEPLTRYAVARRVEARFGGENGVLRTKLQHAYDQVPGLERAGLIRVVGSVPTRTGKERTSLFAATQAGVEYWRSWLAEPIAMPDAMIGAVTRLKGVRPGDCVTMLGIIDRCEATLQMVVHQAVDPGEPAGVADRIGLLWNRRQLIAQLQWCQHARDIIHDEMGGAQR
jgi:DNA-binding PadR family transcriptional regulator